MKNTRSSSRRGGGSRKTRRHIVLDQRDVSSVPTSDGVLVGNTLYVAGRIGVDPESGDLPDDLDLEIKFLLDGFTDVLTESGMTMDDLVTVTIFCPDLSLYERFNRAYRARFTDDLPARAFIGSGPLLLGAHFEMLGSAVKR